MAWSNWRPFPDPRSGEMLVAPIGAGCYELRRIETMEPVLFGSAGNVAKRLSSLLPKPFGTGPRKSSDTSGYCLEHLADLEYRTWPCATRADAKAAGKTLKTDAASYVLGG